VLTYLDHYVRLAARINLYIGMDIIYYIMIRHGRSSVKEFYIIHHNRSDCFILADTAFG